MDIRATDALLVIDPQNDFCEGGRLAVAGGVSANRSIRAALLRQPRLLDRALHGADRLRLGAVTGAAMGQAIAGAGGRPGTRLFGHVGGPGRHERLRRRDRARPYG